MVLGLLDFVKKGLKELDESNALEDFGDEELQELADSNEEEDGRVALFVLLVGRGAGGASACERRGVGGVVANCVVIACLALKLTNILQVLKRSLKERMSTRRRRLRPEDDALPTRKISTRV